MLTWSNCGAFDVSIFSPLLKGASRGSVSAKRKRAEKQYVALVREISEVVEVRLADEDDGAPSWVKANRPARSKGERRKRPHGFGRRREEPTHRVEHATASCPDCQVPLIGGRARGSRRVITLPRVQARVTDHVVLERACPKCRKRWAPEPDWGALSVGRQRFGVSVQSEVSMLREQCRLPFRVIRRYLKWRFGLRLSVGELVDLVRGAAERSQEEYTRLRQEIRASPVVYGDETGWRQDGRNGYLWSFSTPKVRYFLYRPGRSQRVVEEVLGDEFEGVLVQRLLRSLQRVPGAAPEVLDPPVA